MTTTRQRRADIAAALGALVATLVLVIGVPLLLAALAGCSADNVNSPLEFFPGSQATSWADCGKFGNGGNASGGGLFVQSGSVTMSATKTASRRNAAVPHEPARGPMVEPLMAFK